MKTDYINQEDQILVNQLRATGALVGLDFSEVTNDHALQILGWARRLYNVDGYTSKNPEELIDFFEVCMPHELINFLNSMKYAEEFKINSVYWVSKEVPAFPGLFTTVNFERNTEEFTIKIIKD